MGFLDSNLYNQYTTNTTFGTVYKTDANGKLVLDSHGNTQLIQSPGLGAASSLNAQLQDLQKTEAKLKVTIKQDEKDYNAAKKTYDNILTNWYAAHPNTPPDTQTLDALEAQKAAVDSYAAKLKKDRASLTDIQKKITDVKKKIKSLTTKYANPNIPPKSKGGNSGTQSAPPSNTPPFSYKFNAPMVKNAYFSATRSLQELTADGYYIGIGAGDDARDFWKNGNGGRGTLQMDSTATNSTSLAEQAQYLAKSGDISSWDTNLYGYRFSYNPTAITMTWGAVASADPIFASSDNNPSIPIAQNLLQSYLDFNFYVNRIEDFDYIDENGYKGLNIDTTLLNNLDPAQRATAYNAAFASANPYPETVAIEDVQEIYQKGTMYDIDWIFKVLHGGTGFANQTNKFGISTSDVGWLPFRMTEIHLGASLRYRVRITNLTVDHLIFNARMVPVLSKVTMTCARYWDGAATVAGEKAVAAAAKAAKTGGK